MRKLNELYRVSQKKRNGGFSVLSNYSITYILIVSDRIPPSEKNDIKIIKFGKVIQILW